MQLNRFKPIISGYKRRVRKPGLGCGPVFSGHRNFSFVRLHIKHCSRFLFPRLADGIRAFFRIRGNVINVSGANGHFPVSARFSRPVSRDVRKMSGTLMPRNMPGKIAFGKTLWSDAEGIL